MRSRHNRKQQERFFKQVECVLIPESFRDSEKN
jgi:hypothetical protein